MSNSYGTTGYEAGRGRTFTPTVNADWINEFNTLMVDLGKSRNELTEYLIKEGLQSRNRGFEQLNFMSSQELEFIKTPVGRKLLKDYSTLYFGKSIEEFQAEPTKPTKAQENSSAEAASIQSVSSSEPIQAITKNVNQVEPVSAQEPADNRDDDSDNQKAMLQRIQAELLGMKLKK